MFDEVFLTAKDDKLGQSVGGFHKLLSELVKWGKKAGQDDRLPHPAAELTAVFHFRCLCLIRHVSSSSVVVRWGRLRVRVLEFGQSISCEASTRAHEMNHQPVGFLLEKAHSF